MAFEIIDGTIVEELLWWRSLCGLGIRRSGYAQLSWQPSERFRNPGKLLGMWRNLGKSCERGFSKRSSLSVRFRCNGHDCQGARNKRRRNADARGAHFRSRGGSRLKLLRASWRNALSCRIPYSVYWHSFWRTFLPCSVMLRISFGRPLSGFSRSARASPISSSCFFTRFPLPALHLRRR